MKSLKDILESVLGNVDATVENYVEIADKMAKDFAWIKKIKLNDAVYFEAALFYVTFKTFADATKMSDDERRAFAAFLSNTVSPWGCYNWEEIDNWEDRAYCEDTSHKQEQIDYLDMIHAGADDYRWKMNGSNSFYNFFWDADYIHSLDQEDLLRNSKTQKYVKMLVTTAKKYGLSLKTIF